MLLSFVLVVALLGAVTPAPVSGGSQPLREIGHVTSSAVCSAIVSHANSAIDAALRDDETITLSVQTLRQINLDTKNDLEKIHDMQAIDKLADDVRVSAVNAQKQIKNLRELADQATDPVRKAELKAFADALSGALHRQDNVGKDMQSMVRRMHGRDEQNQAYDAIYKGNPGMPPLPGTIEDSFLQPKPNNQLAKELAIDVESRTLDISSDESRAADHIVGAVNGC